MNYYNEIDPFAAAWLRELMKAGEIPEGEVDERDIRDVLPGDLRRYKQCHFFAGIGGWPYALRLAGWPDDKPCWTGSCPCQPFSAAGQRKGAADERHLWPSWFHLIQECRPSVIFGEQVEAAIRHGWLDLVSSDLEGIGYAIGAAGLPAAGVGAPHLRQRLWFVANAKCGAAERRRYDLGETPGGFESEAPQRERVWDDTGASDKSGIVADPQRCERRPSGILGRSEVIQSDGAASADELAGDREVVGCRTGPQGRLGAEECTAELPSGTSGLVGGFWREADWIACRDGKYRPVEPGTFPLAHGVSNRVGKLRGYGNAIVPPLAAELIKAYLIN